MHQLLGNGISMVDLPNNNNLELYINKWKTTIRLVIFHFLMTDKKKWRIFGREWFCQCCGLRQIIALHSTHHKIVHRGILSSVLFLSPISYTRSLAPVDFSGMVFTCAHFQKRSPNIQFIQFSLHYWRNSFTHAFFGY